MISKHSIVLTNKIGEGTTIWQFSVVLSGATIGKFCNINAHTFIEDDVILGDYVTIKSGVYLWNGLRIMDHVFIGPNVTFTNDKFPRSKKYPNSFQETIIEKKASIGAAAIILGGVSIGEGAMIAAGTLVTKNVPSRALVKGSPSKIVGWFDDNDQLLKYDFKRNVWTNGSGEIWIVEDNILIKK